MRPGSSTKGHGGRARGVSGLTGLLAGLALFGAATLGVSGGAWGASVTGAVRPAIGPLACYGSMAGHALSKPIVGIAATPGDLGYWLVATDGGIFTFGDAGFFGSTGAIKLNQPVIGMAPTADGQGYWLAAADAGIFTFGDAHYLGGGPLTQDGNTVNDFSAFAATNDASGYLIADASGSFLLTFGDASYYGLGYTPGSAALVAGLTSPVVNSGYWEAKQDGSVYALTPSAQSTC